VVLPEAYKLNAYYLLLVVKSVELLLLKYLITWMGCTSQVSSVLIRDKLTAYTVEYSNLLLLEAGSLLLSLNSWRG
jgi:hypothetical protein